MRAAFLCLRFRFVLYWRKTVGAKAAHRTLVKLTPGLKYQTKMNRLLGKTSIELLRSVETSRISFDRNIEQKMHFLLMTKMKNILLFVSTLSLTTKITVK